MLKEQSPRQHTILEGMHPHKPIVLQAIDQLTRPEDIRKFRREFEGWLKTHSGSFLVTEDPQTTSYQAILYGLAMIQDYGIKRAMIKRWNDALKGQLGQGPIQWWEADATFATLKGLPISPTGSRLFSGRTLASV